MKKLLFALSAAFLSATSFGQWSIQTSGTLNNLTGVYFLNSSIGSACTDGGEIYRTTDAGVTWTQQHGIGSSMYDISFGSPSNGIAVGAGGSALYSTDGGFSWTTASTGQGYALTGVCFIDADTAYAVGNNGTILKTLNHGQFWSPRTSGTSYDLHSVHFADVNTGYAVGSAGTILKTTDAGATWTPLTSGSGADLYDVQFVDANNGFACGQGGNLLKTTDGGATWLSMASNTLNDLHSLSFVDVSHGWIVGVAGTLLKTFDGGATNWLQSGTIYDLLGVSFVDNMNGFAVGHLGTILGTLDGGCAIPSITVAGANTICDQSSTALTTSGGATTGWFWQPNTGLDFNNVPGPTASPNVSTEYTVSAYSSDGCQGTTTFSITVNPLPSITTTPNDITCYGLNNGSTSAVGTCISYTWQPGNIVSSNLTNLSQGIYTVTGVDANGCMATATSPINEPGQLIAGASLNVAPTCLGINDGFLKDLSLGGTSPLSYTWMPGGQNTSGLNNVGIGTYTLTVNDANNCGPSTTTINVTTQASPIFATISGNNMPCEGLSTQLTYTSTGVAPYMVSWYDAVNAGVFSSKDTADYLQPTPGLDSVTVTVTDANGCITSNTFTLQVGVNDSLNGFVTRLTGSLPVTTGKVYLFEQKNSNVGLLDTISVSSIYGAGLYAFPQVPAGNYLVKVVADSMTYPNAIGTYFSTGSTAYQWDSALVITHSGCTNSSDCCFGVDVIEITPLTGPGVISGVITEGVGFGTRLAHGGFAPLGAPLKGVDVKLGKNPGGQAAARTTTDTSGFYSFTNIPLNQSYRIYVDIPNYGMDSVLVVTLTSADSVSDQNNYYVDSVMIRVDSTQYGLGVITIKQEGADIFVFPNPVSEYINIEWDGNDKAEVCLLNAFGAEVRRSEMARANKTQMDVSGLPEGIYFVQVITAKGRSVRKIMVQH